MRRGLVRRGTRILSLERPTRSGTARRELKVRRASTSEAAEIQIALTGELVCKEYEGYVFVFFVPVDPALH